MRRDSSLEFPSVTTVRACLSWPVVEVDSCLYVLRGSLSLTFQGSQGDVCLKAGTEAQGTSDTHSIQNLLEFFIPSFPMIQLAQANIYSQKILTEDCRTISCLVSICCPSFHPEAPFPTP